MLVLGASGGVGTAACQIASLVLGAKVIAVTQVGQGRGGVEVGRCAMSRDE